MTGNAKHSAFQAAYCVTSSLVFASFLLTAYGTLWEWSTRSYLKGFVDAVVPYQAPPKQQVEAILAWMAHGPRRSTEQPLDTATFRDPETTLNVKGLLAVCGTASNAFLNLAETSGLESRRLLLLAPNGAAKHVAVEVYMDGRWIVVDPTFRAILQDDTGHMLTKQELADPSVLREATRNLHGYDRTYTYERTGNIRLAAVPVIGMGLQTVLDHVFPTWDQAFHWTLLVERQSYGVLVISLGLFMFTLGFRELLRIVAQKYFHVVCVPLRKQLTRQSEGRLALFGEQIKLSMWQ